MDTEANTTSNPKSEYVPPDLSGGAGLPSKRKKKVLLLLLAVVLLVAAAFAVRLFVLKDDNKDKASKPSNNAAQQEEPQEESVYAIPYSAGNPSEGAKLRLRTLEGKEDTTSKAIDKDVYITYAVTNKNQVAVVASGLDTESDVVSVWYSKDFGKSYKKLFGAEAPNVDSFGPQITSLAFSSDGKAVAFGFLPDIADKNTVKEIDIASGESKDLFSLDERGVFLEAYDRAGKKMYYYTGCYNCDGNKMNKLLVHTIDKNVDGIVHEDADRIGAQTVFNDDLSKVLILKMDASDDADGIGYGSEGVIEEVTVANGLVREIIPPLDEEGAMGEIGYVDDSEWIYFAKGDVLYTATDDNSINKLYGADATILDVHYVTETRAIVSKGEYSNFNVVDFDQATQKTTELLKGETNTYIFGVTWK